LGTKTDLCVKAILIAFKTAGRANTKAISESASASNPHATFFNVAIYFGQPSAGLFVSKDFFTRSFQFPLSFNLSAFGPGVAFFFLEWVEWLTTFFLPTNIRLLCNWVFVPQSFSLGCFDDGDRSFAVIHLAIVPEEIKLPQIAMQILAADVVIDADESATDERMARFRSVNMDIGASLLKRSMADCFVRSSPALLKPAISRIFISHQTSAAIYVLVDCLAQCGGCDIGHNATAKLSTALW
jgi:hypothetical protein